MSTLDPEILHELRKAAAAMTSDDKEVERAFADQAYTAIANKAGPLMDDQHRLGFEIVQKNDDNTRLMGIWAFRAGKQSQNQLLYVPVCFINGKVQATDLMYRVGPKKFVVNSPDWARFLIEQSFQTAGAPIPRAEAGKTGPMFFGDRILRTPAAFGKSASIPKEFKPDDWKDLVAAMCKKASTSPILKDYMTRFGGVGAIEELERWIDKSPKFARAMALKMPADNWLSDDILLAHNDRVKRASEDVPTLTLFTGRPTAQLLKHALCPTKVASELFTQGYALEETTPDEHNTIVYGEPGMNLKSPLDPGIYDVMLSGGDTVRAAVGYTLSTYKINDNKSSQGSDCCAPYSSRSLVPPRRLRDLTVVRLEDSDAGDMWSGNAEVWAVPGNEGTLDTAGDPILEADNSVGFLVDPESGAMCGPIEIHSKEKQGDVTHIVYSTYASDKNPDKVLIVNPDAAKNELLDGVVSPSMRFIKLKPLPMDKGDDNCPVSCSWEFKTFVPGGTGDVHKLLINDRVVSDNFKKASISKTIDHDGTALFEIECDGKSSLLMNKVASLVRLSGQLGIKVAAAEEMLAATEVNKPTRWTLELPVKLASSMLQLTDTPRFEDSVDSVQQVPLQVPQAQVLRTVRNPIYRPASRIGDKYDPSKGAVNTDDDDMTDHVPHRIIMSASPDEIAAYAETNQLPHVFEHGVVASLARTYDTSHALDQYIPKMEDGLDALGRCLLLFYWKPDDWKDLYGSDDRSELEGQLLSSFKGFGDLLLDLLKRTTHNARHPASA